MTDYAICTKHFYYGMHGHIWPCTTLVYVSTIHGLTVTVPRLINKKPDGKIVPYPLSKERFNFHFKHLTTKKEPLCSKAGD